MTSAAPPVSVKLKSGAQFKGEVGERVRVKCMQGAAETTLEGTIVKGDAKVLVLAVDKNGKTSNVTILAFDLRSIESLAAATTTPTGGKPAPSTAASADAKGLAPTATSATARAIPNIFVLPLEGTVGIGMRHEEIEQIGKEADKMGPGQLIVLLIDSPGGLVIEGDRIHETMKELKKRHRVVAWIKRAISAAAFTSLHCDEIYFMRVGALGSITMFSGQTAISGNELVAWLDKVGEATEIGGRSAYIGRAMVTNPELLSYDIPEGYTRQDTVFYNTMQGKYKLSNELENLTFNADNAWHCGFSDGTADTVEELAVCLQLTEWKEASDVGRKIHENWQKLLKDCVEQKTKLLADLENPAGSDDAAMLGARIKALTELIRWYDRCKPGMVYEAPNLPEDVDLLKKQLAEFKKALGQMKKRGA
ncbi:MAG: hypothetical protein EXS10_02825 [Phycisphaerales bacterium]|nr:hypothetical protein [Phycisphaerales bacterium]